MTQLADEQQAVVDAPAPAEGVTAAEMYADDAPAAEVNTELPEADAMLADADGDQPQEEEQAQPAIPAPASWAADAKEVFATLPPEVQKTIAERERSREEFLQSKSREVVELRGKVEETVLTQVTEQTQAYAEQLRQIAAMFDVPAPDPRLLMTGSEQDRAVFYQQEAAYRNAQAQREDAQHMAMQAQQQAEAAQRQLLQREEQQERARLAEYFPEVVTQDDFVKLTARLQPIAEMIGYPSELMAQAGALDLKALSAIEALKVKADKYDALNKAKMAPVRAAKQNNRPLMPGSASGQLEEVDISAQLYPDDVRK